MPPKSLSIIIQPLALLRAPTSGVNPSFPSGKGEEEDSSCLRDGQELAPAQASISLE